MKGTALAPEDLDVMPAMARASSINESRSPAYAWLILLILFYVQMVNFVDKAVVGIAAPAIMKDLSLSASEYGWVASSFYALYAIGGLLVAAAFGHRSPGRVLIWLLIIWTLAQTPALFASSAGMLIFSRVILGAGEGAGTPAVINCCYEWFPPERRSFPTAILFFGNTAGKIVAAPLLTIMMLGFGWRSAFGICALLGAIGVVAWLLIGRRGPWAAPTVSFSDGSSGFAILKKTYGPPRLQGEF